MTGNRFGNWKKLLEFLKDWWCWLRCIGSLGYAERSYNQEFCITDETMLEIVKNKNVIEKPVA